jgi:hypothetical protein
MMVQRAEHSPRFHKAVSLNHAMSFFKIILSNYAKIDFARWDFGFQKLVHRRNCSLTATFPME